MMRARLPEAGYVTVTALVLDSLGSTLGQVTISRGPGEQPGDPDQVQFRGSILAPRPWAQLRDGLRLIVS